MRTKERNAMSIFLSCGQNKYTGEKLLNVPIFSRQKELLQALSKIKGSRFYGNYAAFTSQLTVLSGLLSGTRIGSYQSAMRFKTELTLALEIRLRQELRLSEEKHDAVMRVFNEIFEKMYIEEIAPKHKYFYTDVGQRKTEQELIVS